MDLPSDRPLAAGFVRPPFPLVRAGHLLVLFDGERSARSVSIGLCTAIAATRALTQ